MDYQFYPYPSQRMTTVANKGMVATSQPLAAQAGLEILKKGGNAIDAAIATAATLTVVEPTSNGIGGDAFAIVWFKNNIYGLNASGPSPKSINIEAVKERGFSEMPRFGWLPVTVPGVPSAWAELSNRFGNLPLTEVLRPAIEYAENGYPISPTLGKYWNHSFNYFNKNLKDEVFSSWFETFAPKGRAPKTGEIWSSPNHATTLRQIAETNGEVFYNGEIAEKICTFSKKYNGFLTGDDLASYSPDWVQPINVDYRGYNIWELPPNGQGIITLMALNILKDFDMNNGDLIDIYHKAIESIKLSFTDGKKYITALDKMSVSVDELLSDEYAQSKRSLITDSAMMPEPNSPKQSGTVYLATADQDGNMVSYIQSNYMGFGSGLVVPGTGIALQNRGADFSLNSNHINRLEGGKRTYHTIIPGFLTKGNTPIGTFGVMGGYMQPQGHLQTIINTIDFNLNPQAALDAPRWQWVENKKILVENHFPTHIAQALARKGHEIEMSLDSGSFGRGQIIWRDQQTGTLFGGTDPRTDGHVAVW